MSELTQLLRKVIPIITYRNCIVTKTKSGYKVLGVNCKEISDVDNVINNAANSIKKSLTLNDTRNNRTNTKDGETA